MIAFFIKADTKETIMRHKALGTMLYLVATAAAASASDGILIVPQQQPPIQPFEILDQDLLANDDVGATIVSFTSA